MADRNSFFWISPSRLRSHCSTRTSMVSRLGSRKFLAMRIRPMRECRLPNVPSVASSATDASCRRDASSSKLCTLRNSPPARASTFSALALRNPAGSWRGVCRSCRRFAIRPAMLSSPRLELSPRSVRLRVVLRGVTRSSTTWRLESRAVCPRTNDVTHPILFVGSSASVTSARTPFEVASSCRMLTACPGGRGSWQSCESLAWETRTLSGREPTCALRGYFTSRVLDKGTRRGE